MLQGTTKYLFHFYLLRKNLPCTALTLGGGIAGIRFHMVKNMIFQNHFLNSGKISDTKDSSDLYLVHRSELCYEDVVCSDSYHLLYSLNCKSCVDSYFLYDCIGCTDCFGCSNLRNQSHCMWNEQLSKEEYNKRLAEYDLKDYKTILKLKNKF